MANAKHVELLEKGQEAIWQWQLENPGESLDLTELDLKGYSFVGLSIWYANFQGSDLSGVNLSRSRFVGANFKSATLQGANFQGALLVLADFGNADMRKACFDSSNLTAAILSGAQLEDATFLRAIVNRAILPADVEAGDFSQATIKYQGLRSEARSSLFLTDLLPFRDMAAVFAAQRRRRPRFLFPPILLRATLNFYISLARRSVAFVSWPLVHKYGGLQLLTKASYLALIAIPLLAFMWPGVLRLIHAHDEAIQQAVRQAQIVAASFDTAANRAVLTSGGAEARDALLSVSREARTAANRLQSHVIGAPAFPHTFAALYFAAIAVALGHLLYQVFADDIVKHASREQYIRDRLSGFAPGAADSKLRLAGALRMIQSAAASHPDDYHVQLVQSNRVLTQIPTDVDALSSHASHYQWAAVEAAAAIEYELAAKRALVPALLSLVLYAIATVLICYVVAHQAQVVWHAAQL